MGRLIDDKKAREISEDILKVFIKYKLVPEEIQYVLKAHLECFEKIMSEANAKFIQNKFLKSLNKPSSVG